MDAARFDAEADGPSPAGRCQAEGGSTPGPVPQYAGLPSGRVRFSSVVQSQEVTDWAGAWLRVDAADGARALDNMNNRALRGSTGWTEAANVLDVGEDAVSVPSACCWPAPGRWTLPGRVSRWSAPTFRSRSRAGRWRPAPRASTSAPPDPRRATVQKEDSGP